MTLDYSMHSNLFANFRLLHFWKLNANGTVPLVKKLNVITKTIISWQDWQVCISLKRKTDSKLCTHVYII